jgi:hypothetical protein
MTRRVFNRRPAFFCAVGHAHEAVVIVARNDGEPCRNCDPFMRRDDHASSCAGIDVGCSRATWRWTTGIMATWRPAQLADVAAHRLAGRGPTQARCQRAA